MQYLQVSQYSGRVVLANRLGDGGPGRAVSSCTAYFYMSPPVLEVALSLQYTYVKIGVDAGLY